MSSSIEAIEYKPSLITFIDILGFSNAVNTRSATEIHELLKNFSGAARVEEDYGALYDYRYVYFSDTVVRSVNILSDSNVRYRIGLLFYELLALAYVQVDLIQKGILIRGAVTFDFIFHEDEMIFGPGLVSAYQMEKQAVHARIVIDPALMELLDLVDDEGEIDENSPNANLYRLLASDNRPADEKQYILGLVRKGSDDRWFVDYLKVLRHDAETLSEYSDFLSIHRDLIVAGISKWKSTPGVIDKYLWLRRYHNESVSSLQKELKKKDAAEVGGLAIDEVGV